MVSIEIKKVSGDHDPLIMPRMVPVAEAMVAMVLVDYFLQHQAYLSLRK